MDMEYVKIFAKHLAIMGAKILLGLVFVAIWFASMFVVISVAHMLFPIEIAVAVGLVWLLLVPLAAHSAYEKANHEYYIRKKML